MKAILGKKILMTRIFDDEGHQRPVTLLKIENNIVIGKRTQEKDGYTALKIAVGEKKLNRPEEGQVKKTNLKIKPRKLFEIKSDKDRAIGDSLALQDFQEKEKVNATAVSKGKGFAGTAKRHNFHLGPKTHGSHNYRQPGSIGATYPERVIKGRRMAGHLGHNRTTVKNLTVLVVDTEKNEILLQGAVPGPKNSDVLIWSQNESKN